MPILDGFAKKNPSFRIDDVRVGGRIWH